MIVLDASSFLRSALSDSGFKAIERHKPVGPPLLWSEAVAALRQAVWRGEVDEESGKQALTRLLTAPVERKTPRRLYEEAWLVSQELGWAKTYDAEYVALARLLGCRLLTTDARLKRGASTLVEIISPDELR